MSISKAVFKTPVPETYRPAESIARNNNQLQYTIAKAQQQGRADQQAKEEGFGRILNNIGELEGVLQENYAGINQTAIDNTREWIKENFKSGAKPSDPDFQAELGKRTGRIRAGIYNAERMKGMADQEIKAIANDPNIVDKDGAVAAILEKASTPEFLLSKNTPDFTDIRSNFVDDRKVFENFNKSLPTLGEIDDQFTDEEGNLVGYSVITNELIDSEQPLVNGRPNIKITPELSKRVMEGEFGEALIDKTLNIANEKYTDYPADVAFAKALKDGVSQNMGINYKQKTIKNAEQLERERAKEARAERSMDLDDARNALAYKREQRLSNQEITSQEEANEINKRYEEFQQASTKGDIGFLGEYENQKSGVKDFEWVNADEEFKAEKEIAKKVSTKATWDALSRDERVKIIESIGLEDKVPSALGGIGRMDTKSDEAYKSVKEAIDKVPSGILGLRYKVKTGTSGGEAVYETVEIPTGNQEELVNAFRSLENLRRSGTKMKPTTEVPEEEVVEGKDLTGLF